GGRPPDGPAVLVANHCSHADTAVLLATLSPARRPVFVAAADYWFTSSWRRWVVTGLVGPLPIRRDGDGYAALREAAAPVLGQGGTVVIYPEGTRATDGRLGRFRSGALRLAQDLEVPLVPVGISGTDQVLPKSGRLRPAGVVLRFGEPLSPRDCATTSAETVRAAVQALRDDSAAVPWPDSPSWVWLDGRRTAVLAGAAFAWGAAEAVSWPVMAEYFLLAVGVPQPRRMLPVATALAAGSVAGVVAHGVLARRGVRFPAPLTTPRMHQVAREQLAASPYGVLRQAVNGVPVKVYARAAGEEGTDLLRFTLGTLAARPARVAVVGAALTLAGSRVHPLVRRRFPEYLLLSSAAFAEGLSRVLRRWR
uniref:lysophospholipid acyltransferase family protein n=1 Tax=Ornithinicoccus halotolerans TaxID=1748220 RepID=UPI001298207B